MPESTLLRSLKILIQIFYYYFDSYMAPYYKGSWHFFNWLQVFWKLELSARPHEHWV